MTAAAPLSFEELEIGQVFHGTGRTLSETDLVMFSMITGDWSAIHADEIHAQATRIGRRMFHGSFGVALALAMSAGLLRLTNPVIAALGIRQWSFLAPIFIGDTVHLDLEIVEKRPTSDGRRAIIGRRLRLLKADAVPVQEGLADLMIGLPERP